MSRFFDPQRIQRLVTFGDSWTAGHGVETDLRYRDIARPEPFVHNLRLSNSWPRWLAQALDIPFVNLAEAGICNVGIKRSIENHRPWIDPDTDLVIVMWSFPYRHHQWMDTLGPGEVALGDILGSAQELLRGYRYRFCNSFYPTFAQEPELLQHLDVSDWLHTQDTAAQALREYEQRLDVSVWEYGSRDVHLDHHGYTTGDYHPNLLGYRIIAEWLYHRLRS